MLPFLPAATHFDHGNRFVEAPPTVKSAKEFVAEISVKLGKTVELEKSLQRIPLLVDAGTFPASKLLTELAFALHSHVVSDGKVLRIERSTSDRSELGAVHSGEIRVRIQNCLDTWDRILARATTYGDPAAQVTRARDDLKKALSDAESAQTNGQSYDPPRDFMGENMVSPAGYFLREIVRRIGAEELSKVNPSEVRFFGNHPNGAESPLPKCDDLLANYSLQQDKYLSSTGGNSLGAPTKVIVRLDEGGLSATFFNAAGKKTDEGWISYDMRILYTPSLHRAIPTGPSAWESVAEPGQRIRTILAPSTFHFALETLPPEYLHPETFDPLNFAVRQGILAVQRPARSALIAVLSDDLLRLSDEFVSESRLDTAEFGRALFSRGGYEMIKRDDDWVVRPKDQLVGESTLVDRVALGKGVRLIVADKSITPRNWSALSYSLYSVHYQPVKDRYLTVLRRLGFREFKDVSSHAEGQYALVSATLQVGRVVQNSGSAPFGSLVSDGLRHGWLTFKGRAGATDLDLSPSTLLASRQTAARISPISSEKPVYEDYRVGVENAQNSSFEGVDLEQLGNDFALQGRRPSARMEKEIIGRRLKEARFRVGRQIILGSEVTLEGTVQARVELLDAVCDRTGLTLDQLPQAVQDGIMAIIQKQFDAPRKPSSPR